MKRSPVKGHTSKNKSGFTLVEIMIVVMILGVLMNIALPAFVHARDEGQSRACVSNLKKFVGAKEQYALNNSISGASATPVTWTNIQQYMRGTQPLCPTNYPGLNTYTLGSMSQDPTCAYAGPAGQPTLAHVLP